MPTLAGPIQLAAPHETEALAARFASRLGAGDCLLLSGPIGAGKSAFARALIRARLGDPAAEVPSPTFTLVQVYETDDTEIWHTDLYRLTGPSEALELGLAEAFETAICLVEWPDRLADLAPEGALTLALADAPPGRSLTISGPESWRPRLETILA
ncbi:hypothetical protein OG2516_11171 [Oceanicola granulosus HTCC2516]|uniref:tRNA threonylcarbamoyladenosine biosynthesis protein TsaE n=1 Tax=Oceanicola granulosus (strain ATCC BAA-861 / DSM 15982 / KCTC 12143 / HTCC2516) TaxID=314256 RepID=Q2CJW9_OCEGH|nr:tRNA (adenosine(37)-N6)-threonylcarbamoyltransferase complex ATPase subunit type 1 TsaE [Oceanicola granulosus]EAR53020.1 hypothetical protein OG2516_11171 [Oceanicola granulosus HTCC2516]